LVEISLEKQPLESPKGRWEDNIKMHLREIGYEDGTTPDYIQWQALVVAVSKLWALLSHC
jgi:hypothetical protein